MGDLEALLQVLEGHRSTLEAPEGGWQDPSFETVFPGLPLFHRLGNPLRDREAALSTGKIVLEISKPKTGRAALGTDQCLFASWGVAPHWVPPIVMAFGPAEAYRTERLSVPWDSRGAAAVAGWDQIHHQGMIDLYSLPAPDDERFLARYLATYFQEWEVFLSGQRPVAPDPADVRVLLNTRKSPEDRDLAWVTTPEARFPSNQEVGERLLAVFVDADYPDGRADKDDWRETYTLLRRIVERRNRNGFRSLRRMQPEEGHLQASAAEFARNWLRITGYLP